MKTLLLGAACVVIFGSVAVASNAPPVVIPLQVSQGGLYGLRYALDPSLLGSPSGTTAAYNNGDTITLSCPGVTFTTAPIIGVTQTSSQTITGTTIANPGVTYGPPPAATVTCSQASTSGSGTGYQVSVGFGLIAAYVMPQSLATGGGAYNGNFFLNVGPSDGANFSFGGLEDTFVGDKAGSGAKVASSYDAAFGHNSCGNGGTGTTASDDVCVGDDAGRNIQGAIQDTVVIGSGAGRNLAGSWNVYIGSGAAGSASSGSAGHSGTNNAGLVTGYNNVALGFSAASSMTTGNGNTLIGAKAGSGVTTGSGNVIISATAGNDNCGMANTTDYFAICAGSTAVIATTGGGTPSTAATKVSGTINTNGYTVATLPTGAQGMRAYVTDATSCSFLGSLTGGGSTFCPVVYNGSAWVAE